MTSTRSKQTRELCLILHMHIYNIRKQSPTSTYSVPSHAHIPCASVRRQARSAALSADKSRLQAECAELSRALQTAQQQLQSAQQQLEAAPRDSGSKHGDAVPVSPTGSAPSAPTARVAVHKRAPSPGGSVRERGMPLAAEADAEADDAARWDQRAQQENAPSRHPRAGDSHRFSLTASR